MPLDYNLPPPYYGYSAVLPAWSITYELYFYAVFAVALLVTSRYRTLLCTLLIVAVGLALQIGVGSGLTIGVEGPVPVGPTLLNNVLFAGNPIVLDFIAGMFAGEFFIKWPKMFSSRAARVAVPLLLGYGIAVWLSAHRHGHGFTNGAGGALALFLGVLVLEKSSDLMVPKFAVFLGDISYSLYMSHTVVQNLLEKYEDVLPMYLESRYWRKYALTVIAALAVATVLRAVVEKPSARLSNWLLRRARS